MPERFDYVVIGGGPAGEKGAAQAAYFGKRVALVEREPYMGGACVNTGTIPSKTLRETCLHLSGFKQRGLRSLERTPQALTAEELLGRAHATMEAERARMRRNMDRHGVTVLTGAARFVAEDAVEIAGPARRIEGEKFLIAVGSSPHRPDGIDFAHPLVDDSDEILALQSVPSALLVVGAGVIGCEYATMFAALGTRVTILDGRDTLMPFLDREIAERLAVVMREDLAVDLRLGRTVARLDPRDDGVTTWLSDGTRLDVDRALFAAGRVGNTKGLGLEVLGIQPDKRGLVQVDAHYQTSAPHVYAVGDVIGFPALASVSMEQARVATTHAFGLGYKDKVDPLLPMGIYTIPEISSIGESEESARAKGMDVETGRASYSNNARGQIMGDHSGLIKLVFRKQDKVLVGAHVLGENAAELIHVASAVLHFGGTIDAFIELVFNFPTLADAYKYAAYDGLGRLAGKPGPSSVTSIGT